MFAFSSPIAEPLLLLFFGVVFLAAATGVQVRLARKQRVDGQQLELLSSESNPRPGAQPVGQLN